MLCINSDGAKESCHLLNHLLFSADEEEPVLVIRQLCFDDSLVDPFVVGSMLMEFRLPGYAFHKRKSFIRACKMLEYCLVADFFMSPCAVDQAELPAAFLLCF